MLGKLMEETGEMERGKGRDVGRRDREIKGKSGGETGREGGREWGRGRGGGRNSRRLGDMEEEAGKWERNNWGTQGLPEVKGNWISMWSQPSIFFFPGASKTRRRKQQRGEGAGVGDPVRALLPILLRQPLPPSQDATRGGAPLLLHHGQPQHAQGGRYRLVSACVFISKCGVGQVGSLL